MLNHTIASPKVIPVARAVPPHLAYAADDEPVLLRHLTTPCEIEAVLPLREGIDLSAHAAAGAAFLALEKKETSWVS
ncbi:hypothetical protein WG922_20890 [Ramlibacter sp. AN1015]|uniref:hypothetical protein n=1 Tax=Ramlibacter sp. AN1015 TaxID=3133428 RepID=UPI0030C08EB2